MSAFLFLLTLLLLAASAFADMIVLKNDRRIIADSVSEAGDQVIYERLGGQISFLFDPATANRWLVPEILSFG